MAVPCRTVGRMGPRQLFWMVFGLATGALLAAVGIDLIVDEAGRGAWLWAAVLTVALGYAGYRLARAVACQVRSSGR